VGSGIGSEESERRSDQLIVRVAVVKFVGWGLLPFEVRPQTNLNIRMRDDMLAASLCLEEGADEGRRTSGASGASLVSLVLQSIDLGNDRPGDEDFDAIPRSEIGPINIVQLLAVQEDVCVGKDVQDFHALLGASLLRIARLLLLDWRPNPLTDQILQGDVDGVLHISKRLCLVVFVVRLVPIFHVKTHIHFNKG
jgi:hypothetical protein